MYTSQSRCVGRVILGAFSKTPLKCESMPLTRIQNFRLSPVQKSVTFFSTGKLPQMLKVYETSSLQMRRLSLSSRLSSGLMPKVSKVVPSLSQAQLSALRFKTRKNKKRNQPGKDEWSVVGYSTAESFDMLGLQEGLNEQLIYSELDILEELNGNCIAVTNKYNSDKDDLSKEIFFFKDGNIIFWNVPELERSSVLKFTNRFALQSYEEDLIYEESELMNFSFSSALTKPTLEKGLIMLNPHLETFLLDKYTFSDAIASSVKLGAWEAALDNIIDSIEHISEDLKNNGNVRISSREVLQKSGEILALRHVINLSSDLLDTPDFYWDREGLENLFLATCSHLAVAKRTKIVNEKLNHCLELMELVSTHLSTDHGARLEWIIIVLIFIEICFEVLHLVERKFGGFTVLGGESDSEH